MAELYKKIFGALYQLQHKDVHGMLLRLLFKFSSSHHTIVNMCLKLSWIYLTGT